MTVFKLLPKGAYPFLYLDDAKFLKECRIDPYMASGHGGQKRNRTYSAIRITHTQTGISVIASDARSQGENKKRGLRRLRKALSLKVRWQKLDASSFSLPECVLEFFSLSYSQHINKKNPVYPIFCAALLDVLYLKEGKISVASAFLQISTGRLIRMLARDKDLWEYANQLRTYFTLKPLKKTL